MTRWQKASISAVLLAAMLVFGYRQTLAPGMDTSSGLDFTALNRHVAVIAAKPHPIGSIANQQVRDYIVGYFASLGLTTEVQKTTVVYRHPHRSAGGTTIGQVENIIARLPGRSEVGPEAASDLVLMAHYDSTPSGPGAADDASGTASIMEVARILATAPPPAHDVVFLITDGEEAGLLGAQGFFRQHPAAKKVGLVLNFEARGSYGASFMFETSNGNAWLIDQLIDATPGLLAGSLSYEIYRRMPNDTDLSISKGEGFRGLNFAFSAGLIDYHAMTDTIQNLAQETLAQQANYVLATAQHFANLDDWQSTADDLTYFNLWRGVIVSYSQGLAIALGSAVLLLGAWLLVTALRNGTTGPASIGNGFLAVLCIFLMVYSVFENLVVYLQKADAGMIRITSLGEWPLLAYFVATLGMTLWFGYRFKRGLSRIDAFLPPLLLVLLILLTGRFSVYALAVPALLLPLMLTLRSRPAPPDLHTAALCLWWLLTAVLLYLAPNAAYLLVWPLASVLVGILIQRRLPVGTAGKSWFLLVLVLAFIPLLLLPPIYILAYLALGLAQPQVLMVICCLSLLLIWPLLRSIGSVAEGKVALAFIGAGVLMTAAVVFGRDFDARHPRPEELFYAIDVDQQKAFWASPDARPGSWLGEFLGERARTDNTARILPGYDQPIQVMDDELPAYTVSTLSVVSDRANAGVREIHLHLQAAGAGAYINLLFANDAGIATAAVNGFAVDVPAYEQSGAAASEPSSAQAWWRWRWYGLPAQGADIVLTLPAGRPLQVRVVEVDYRLPDGAPARPENSMRKPYSWSDSTVIFQTVTLE